MISEETVTEISNYINNMGQLDEVIISDLRNAFDQIHFTYCSDDDISDITPVLEQELFNIYLVNGHDHCLKMTKDYEAATGVVVAEVYPE